MNAPANALVALKCPNCGGGLGPPAGAEYLCQYCGHRSRPRVALAPAEQQAALAAALARFEQRRNQIRSGRAAIRKQQREAFLAKRDQNAWVCFGIGGLFTLIAAVAAVNSLRMAEPFSIGVAGMGLVWTALTALMFTIGWRYRRAGAREKRLRANGIRGRATVASYKETRIVVDGNPRVELVLHVELPHRAPYDVKCADYIPVITLVTEGTELPVFVDANDANDVMVDWWAD